MMGKQLLSLYTGLYLLFCGLHLLGQNAIIKGRVVSSTREEVAYATIKLLSWPDSIFRQGTVTGTSGEFILQNISAGNYIIHVQSLGYKTYISAPFVISQNEPVKELGDIVLIKDVKRLKEIEITAEKPFIQQQADKRIYNVEKNFTTSGGNAADLLQHIPSVSLDADGNISLRGSENIQILINGKPTTLAGGDRASLLQQIPANNIVSIEVITNPSSRYDAEGSSGIINIITKRTEKENISGHINLHHTIYNKAGMNAHLQYKNKSFLTGVNYSIQYNPRFFDGYSFRKNIFPDTLFSSEQINYGDRVPLNQNIRLNTEYYFSRKTTLGATISYHHELSTSPETIFFRNYDMQFDITSEAIRKVTNHQTSDNYDVSINLKHAFSKTGTELTADITFSRNNRNELLRFNDEILMTNHANGFYPFPLVQTNFNNTTTDMYLFQTDYVHSLNSTSKIETGAKATIRNIIGYYELQYFDTTRKYFQPDLLNGQITFRYTEQVYAGYLLYSNTWKKINYQSGLRGEQTVIAGRGHSLATPDATISRHYFNLFPSASVAYTFAQQHQLQGSYSMRISRPWFRQLLPFAEVADPYNQRIGNPNLNPEIFHSFEINWSKKVTQHHFLSVSIYYRQTNNNISRIRKIDAEGISTITFENLNRQFAYGSEMIIRNQFFKWWDMTTSFNGYQSQVNGSNIAPNMTNRGFAFSLKNNTNFRFRHNTSLQITTQYQAPIPTAQGRLISVWGIDLAAKKDLIKNKATLTLNMQDIFFTRRFGVKQNQPQFEQTFWRTRETRVLTFSFNYRFGSNDTGSTKRKGKNFPSSPDGEREIIDF